MEFDSFNDKCALDMKENIVIMIIISMMLQNVKIPMAPLLESYVAYTEM